MGAFTSKGAWSRGDGWDSISRLQVEPPHFCRRITRVAFLSPNIILKQRKYGLSGSFDLWGLIHVKVGINGKNTRAHRKQGSYPQLLVEEAKTDGLKPNKVTAYGPSPSSPNSPSSTTSDETFKPISSELSYASSTCTALAFHLARCQFFHEIRL